jgi:hypothetical protein
MFRLFDDVHYWRFASLITVNANAQINFLSPRIGPVLAD